MTEERKTTDAQAKASRNWEKKNPSRNYYLTLRRSSRNFIRNHATEEDLQELESLNIIKSELKDSEYKKNLKIKDYSKIEDYLKTNFTEESKTLYKRKLYSPDIIFQQNDKKYLIVEQSSTAVKKVHIAEFIQFLKLAELNPLLKFEFLLILTQKKSNTPKEYKKNEITRLKAFVPNQIPENIEGVYVLEDTEKSLTVNNNVLKLESEENLITKF